MATNRFTKAAAGLYTAPNQFSAPDGALSSSSGILIKNQGVIQNSPKLTSYETDAPGGAYNGWFAPISVGQKSIVVKQPAQFDSFGNVAVPGAGTGTMWVTAVDEIGGTLFQGLKPSGSTDNSARAYAGFTDNGNYYFNCGWDVSGAGFGNPVIRYDGFNATLGTSAYRWDGAGMAEALTPFYYTSTAAPGGGNDNDHGIAGLPAPATSTVITATSNNAGGAGGQVAYRVVYASKDPNNNLVRGAPSGRMIVYSASAALTYGIVIPLMAGGVYSGDILQLYRSETAYAGTGFTAEPSDELRQCYEYIVQSADVTAGYVAIANDLSSTSPPSGPALYTNATQDGILAAKMRPPCCSTSDVLNGTAFYGGVADKLKILVINILGLSGWSVAGGSETSFTVGSVTAKAALQEDLPNHKFHLDTTSATTSQKLFNTARSIARVLSYGNTTNYAVFASSANDFTPSIIVKTFIAGDSVNTTLTTANLPAGTISPQPSSNRLSLETPSKSSYLYFSSPGEPEAVPDLNFISVGETAFAICAVKRLRDSLFVFKEDGLFRVTGTSESNIRVELFDATIKSQRTQQFSCASAGNLIFYLCNKGVVAVTESNATVISVPIDNLVEHWKGLDGPLQSGPWPTVGWASEHERTYYILLQDLQPPIGAHGFVDSPIYPTLYAFNFLTGTWTQTVCHAQCMGGCVKGISYDTVYGTEVIETTGSQTTTTYREDATQFSSSPTWTYPVKVSEDPGTLTRFYDVSLALTGSVFNGSMTATFSSDSGAAPASVVQAPVTTAIGIDFVRFQVPREHSYCGQLTVQITAPSTGTALRCGAFIIKYDEASDRIARQ